MVPHLAAAALARGAEMAGAQLFENVSVTGILQDRGAVTGVSTDMGDIACEYVVIAAGMWSRDIGLSAGVKVPAHGRRAHVPRHQAHGTALRREVPPRPGRADLLPPGPGGEGRNPDGRLRVGRQALARRPPRRLQLQPGGARLGALQGVLGKRHIQGASHGRGGHRSLLRQRRELHPGQPLHPGRGARAAEHVPVHGPELHRHSCRARLGPRRRRVDGRGPSHDGPVGGRPKAFPPVPERAQVPLRPHRGIGGDPVRDALAPQADGDRPDGAQVAPPRPAGRPRRVLRRGGGMGATQLVRSRGSRPEVRVLLRTAELVRLLGRRAPGRAGGRGPLRPDLLRQVHPAGRRRRPRPPAAMRKRR